MITKEEALQMTIDGNRWRGRAVRVQTDYPILELAVPNGKPRVAAGVFRPDPDAGERVTLILGLAVSSSPPCARWAVSAVHEGRVYELGCTDLWSRPEPLAMPGAAVAPPFEVPWELKPRASVILELRRLDDGAAQAVVQLQTVSLEPLGVNQ